MKNDDFFTSDFAWAKRKYNLASAYLARLTAKPLNTPPPFYCADTFSYPVQSRGGHQLRPLSRVGDPYSSKQFGIKVIAVPMRTHTTTGHCRSPKDVSRAKIAVLSRVIAVMRNKPALLFVDLQGPPRIPFAALEPFLSRSQEVTEIVVRFDADAIWRDAADICASQRSHDGPCKNLVQQVANMLGFDELRDMAVGGPGSAVVGNFMARVAEYGFTVVAYPIRDALHCSTHHYLLYGTRDRKNIRMMNNVIRSTEDQLLREYYRLPQVKSFDDAVRTDIFFRREELKQLILEYQTTLAPISRGGIKWHVFLDRFGDFHENDFDAVMTTRKGVGRAV